MLCLTILTMSIFYNNQLYLVAICDLIVFAIAIKHRDHISVLL